MTRRICCTCLRLVVALGVLSTSAAFGQPVAPKYKVGDHVEFSANGACLGEQFAIPTQGTILQVNLGYTMNYVMQVDPEPGRSPRTVSRPIYTQDCGFRPSAAPAPAGTAAPPAPPPVQPAAQIPVGGATNVPKYKVGDHVEFSANGACLGEQFAIPTKGTILQVNLGYTMNYVIQVDPEPGRSPRTATKPIYTQDCGFRPLAEPAPARATVPPAPAPAPVNPAVPAPAGGPTNGPKYKVGDHVEFSANGACLGQPFAIPTKGTIVQVNLGYTMNYVMQVDPEPNKSPKTISRPIYTQDCGFRLLGGPAPAAPKYNCPLNPPAGPVSKADGPSQQVFERVIYDDAVAAEATHADVQAVGMSFEIFQMGQPYTNQMTEGGLRQDASLHLLMHDGAPPNAVIYPVKVRYSRCIQRPTWKQLWVIEENRDCFKNKFGDWACPVGTGATKFLTQIDLPN